MRAYRGPAFNSASAYVRKFFNLKRLIDPGLCKPTSLLYSSRVISSSSSESLLLIVKCIDHTTKHGHQCKSVMLRQNFLGGSAPAGQCFVFYSFCPCHWWFTSHVLLLLNLGRQFESLTHRRRRTVLPIASSQTLGSHA
jgi:hypothetical protein